VRALVTGGAGYIGAHLVADLLTAGHDVVVLDDLSHGSTDDLARAQAIASRRAEFVLGRVGDPLRARAALAGVDVVFHLAAEKHVGESVRRPGHYFSRNVGEMAVLLREMNDAGVRRMVYSSSAAVYGPGAPGPIPETAALRPGSPYGATKQMGEQMLADMTRHAGWSAVSLRYFNPVGAHPSGRLGESPERANSLVARVLRALLCVDCPLTVFGTDYDTSDGSCVRDFVHVNDVSQAHLAALAALDAPGHRVYNVGTGHGHSVREVLAVCAEIAGRPVPHRLGARRAGDAPVAVADCSKMARELGFSAQHDLTAMLASAWVWAKKRRDAVCGETSAARPRGRGVEYAGLPVANSDVGLAK